MLNKLIASFFQYKPYSFGQKLSKNITIYAQYKKRTNRLKYFKSQSLPIWHKKRQTRQASRHDGFDHFYFSLIMYILGLLSSGDYVLSGDENGDLNLIDLYTLRVGELSM